MIWYTRKGGGNESIIEEKELNAKILAVPIAAPLPAKPKRPYLPNGTKHISPCQADSIIEAAKVAREMGGLLNTHATIHWALTNAEADTDGQRFAKVREGFRHWCKRHGIEFMAVWVREAQEQHYGQHAHMVFHLPGKWQKGKRLKQVEQALERLVERHGEGVWGDNTVRLKLHTNGDVRYLLKGGTPEVWRKYKVKRKWRKPQGICIGKRSGSTQNLSPKARERWWYG